MTDFNITGYENLIIGIIKQAAVDYKKAYRQFVKNPRNESAANTMTQCEKFFLERIDMYQPIVPVNGSYLVRELKQSVEGQIATEKSQKSQKKKAA